jgi:8-oxo-dGTP pyrophosphatase MutT (NUDIX family)
MKKTKKTKKPKIRVIALGLIINQDLIFLSEGYDKVKKQTFYRALGGGVKFGESSLEALKREFKEEINAEITNIIYLGTIENVFTYNGEKGHEIIQLYQCDFVDSKFYEIEKLTFIEKIGKNKIRQKTALWLNLEQYKKENLVLVPEEFLSYL